MPPTSPTLTQILPHLGTLSTPSGISDGNMSPGLFTNAPQASSSTCVEASDAWTLQALDGELETGLNGPLETYSGIAPDPYSFDLTKGVPLPSPGPQLPEYEYGVPTVHRASHAPPNMFVPTQKSTAPAYSLSTAFAFDDSLQPLRPLWHHGAVPA